MNSKTKGVLAGLAISSAVMIAVMAQTQHRSNTEAPAHSATLPEGASAQQGPRDKAPLHSPIPSIIEALDTNHDWVISEDEIANAVKALKSLDANQDGKLTMDEILPPAPGGTRAIKHSTEKERAPGGRPSGTIRHSPTPQ